MIPTKSSMTQSDTMGGKEIQFSVGDPRFVMKALADLYSDSTLAVIREYSTNAADANIMAGVKSPIRVTLPTTFNPAFTVEDDGVGLSLDDFDKIYTQFGISNKRDSEDTNGMLGFGSKCGVAYTNQFTVTSVKDGLRIVGVVVRRPDWGISLKVLSEMKTDDANGTKISIPIHNVDEFRAKAQDFYRFWEAGKVVIDGKAPEVVLGDMVAPGIFLSPDANSYVVMGSVAYRIHNPQALFNKAGMPKGFAFVAYAKSGSLEFTPSREDLAYTDLTRATLDGIIREVVDNSKMAAQTEIDSAQSHNEAVELYIKWRRMLPADDVPSLYKGEKIPLMFSGTFSLSDRPIQGTSNRASNYTQRSISFEKGIKTLIVTEFPHVVSSKHRSAAFDYKRNLPSFAADFNGTYGTHAVAFTSASYDELNLKWLGDKYHVKWEDLKKTIPKKPRAAKGASGRVPGSWDYIDANLKQHLGDIIPDDSTLYYFDTHTKNQYRVEKHLKIILNEEKNKKKRESTVAVYVPENRLVKFKRDNPTAQSLVVKTHAILKERAKAHLPTPSDTIEVMPVRMISLFRGFRGLDLEDPRLKDLTALAMSGGRRSTVSAEFAKVLDEAYELGMYSTKSIFGLTYPTPKEVPAWDATKEYPLLKVFAESYRSYTTADLKAMADYANLVYNYNRKEGN